jgi:hypothetical protein
VDDARSGEDSVEGKRQIRRNVSCNVICKRNVDCGFVLVIRLTLFVVDLSPASLVDYVKMIPPSMTIV